MKTGRKLFLDPVADQYHEDEIVSDEQYLAYGAVGFVDVTDDPVHEKLFQLYLAKGALL